MSESGPNMLKLLREPLPNRLLPLFSMAIVAAVAGYCVAYRTLSGASESLLDASAWAAVNVLPWFLGFEAAKRTGTLRLKAAALAAALGGSLLLQVAISAVPAEPGFELVRRLPGLLLVALLLALGALPALRRPAAAELPLLPGQIDWVAAAGNYVEIHGSGRTIVHRSSLGAVEAELGRHDFIRIHRSTLVRRSAIARVRSVDLLLDDGTSLKVGSRYRSALGRGAADIRPFVPAE